MLNAKLKKIFDHISSKGLFEDPKFKNNLHSICEYANHVLDIDITIDEANEIDSAYSYMQYRDNPL